MDHRLRPHLRAEAPGAVGAPAAAFEIRRREIPVSPDRGRDELGPALFATPLVTVGRWRCPAENAVFPDSGPARWHLFVFPRTSVWIQHDGAPRFVADPTVVTFYNAGQRYRRFALSPAGDRGEWFSVAPAALADVLERRDPGVRDRGPRLFPFSHGPSDRTSYLTQRAVYEHVCRQREPDPLFVEEAVLGVLDRVAGLAYGSRRRPPARASARDHELADAARSVLARRFADRASLLDVARDLPCSPFHLARVFRRVTGRTLHAHRTDLRMRVALERLADPSSDLLTLALSLGYASHSHFGDVFRAVYGVPPSDVRRGLARGVHPARVVALPGPADPSGA